MKCWCKCTGRKPWAENMFTTGSNAFATGRKQLRMSHVRVSCRQAEPQTWSSECDKCWHKIGEWLYDWWRRTWALARTRCTPSFTKIWLSGRSVPGLCRTSWQANRKQNGWKLLEISLPCVTRIHPLCEPSSRDETWCYQFDPESKQQSMELRSPSSPRPKKSRLQKSKVKTMLIALFDSYGIIHKEFVPVDQTINSAFYEEVLKLLLWRIHHVWPELHRTGQWMLLHDNAPSHCATRVHQFLAQRGVPILDHPPYSPNLAPADFFLFPRLKSIVKGARFADMAAIQEHVTGSVIDS